MSTSKILRAIERDVIAICNSANPNNSNESDILFDAEKQQEKILRANSSIPALTAKEQAMMDMASE